MSKKQAKATERKDASKELLAQVAEAINAGAEAGIRSRYSTAKVYAAHNAVQGLDEKPANCSSCVMRRVQVLRRWFGGVDEIEAQMTQKEKEVAQATTNPVEPEGKTTKKDKVESDATPANYTDPEGENYQGPAEGVIRLLFDEGVVPVDFTPSAEDATKGTVARADGKGVQAGTYETANGATLVVAVGNKATYTELS